MVGERIREVRQSQGRSLANVAGAIGISIATLSRVENGKQSVDLGLFLSIARTLSVAPNELLDDDVAADERGLDPLVRRIASLAAKERTMLWREIAAHRRAHRGKHRGEETRNVSHQVEELLAQVDFLREELEAVRKRIKR